LREYNAATLVEHFEFFSENIGEKLPLFCTHFSLRKYIKNLKVFQYFVISFQKFHLVIKKFWKSFKFFTYFFSEKSVKNDRSFSPIFSLKNLKCSTSARNIMTMEADNYLSLKCQRNLIAKYSREFSPGTDGRRLIRERSQRRVIGTVNLPIRGTTRQGAMEHAVISPQDTKIHEAYPNPRGSAIERPQGPNYEHSSSLGEI
jgi:hypothetical protein